MELDEIYLYILKYLSSKESFIYAISKSLEECIKYRRIPFISKTALLIQLNKKGSILLKTNY